MNANFVIVGLPASGKTTFLAALWHLVESGEVECRLELESYSGDYVYLNKISEAWRNFKKVPRTSQVGDVDVTISLKDRLTGAAGIAFFPDLAGETFDTQVELRRCRPEFVDGVAADDGILLFVSSDIKGDYLSIAEFNAMMPPVEGGDPEAVTPVEDADDETAPRKKKREWEPKLVPAQVRVVQILSDLLRHPFEPRRRRIGVMVSAWDLAQGMGLSPAAWLAVSMPLVDQFLRSNAEWFESVVYGVSAQGLRLDDSAAVDAAVLKEPSRRILLVGPEGEGHDLTLPLVRLMTGK